MDKTPLGTLGTFIVIFILFSPAVLISVFLFSFVYKNWDIVANYSFLVAYFVWWAIKWPLIIGSIAWFIKGIVEWALDFLAQRITHHTKKAEEINFDSIEE